MVRSVPGQWEGITGYHEIRPGALSYQLHRRASIELLALRATRSCRDGSHSRSSWGGERLCKHSANDVYCTVVVFVCATARGAFFWYRDVLHSSCHVQCGLVTMSVTQTAGHPRNMAVRRSATIQKQCVLSAVSHWLRWVEGGVADRRLAAINGCRWFGRRQPARQLFAVGPPGIIAERQS